MQFEVDMEDKRARRRKEKSQSLFLQNVGGSLSESNLALETN